MLEVKKISSSTVVWKNGKLVWNDNSQVIWWKMTD